MISTIFTIASLFTASVSEQMEANRLHWERDGFYGFPVEVEAVCVEGDPVRVTLLDSTLRALPSEGEEFYYAVLKILAKS